MELADSEATTYPAAGEPQALFVFAHGAGAGQRHPFMTGMARALAAGGIDVVTFDFPYMRQRRGAPDRPPVLEQAFREVIEAARAWSTSRRLFIGGKSMGGRMATHVAAQGLNPLAGVIVFGYPLHPPGKPTQLRTAHLPDIAVPMLIIQGERDPFGTPAELRPHLESMQREVTLHVIERGDHSLTVRGRKPEELRDEAAAVVTNWMKTVQRSGV